MKNLLTLLGCAVVVLVAASPAVAEEGGFSLNPFARKAGPPTSGSSMWKMPSLWPSAAKATPAPKPAGPTVWQKMTTGTKNFWSKTADAMNPWDDAQDRTAASAAPSGRGSFRQASARRGAEPGQSKSFLPSWSWGGEEEPKEPMTVNKFLAQPRPGY